MAFLSLNVSQHASGSIYKHLSLNSITNVIFLQEKTEICVGLPLNDHRIYFRKSPGNTVDMKIPVSADLKHRLLCLTTDLIVCWNS